MADQTPTTYFDTFSCIVEPAADAPVGKEFIGVSHRGEMICLSLCTVDGQMLTCSLGKDGWNKLMFAAAKHISALGDTMTFYDPSEAAAPPTLN